MINNLEKVGIEMRGRILVVGDVKDRDFLKDTLRQQLLYDVSIVERGTDGIRVCKTWNPDVIIVNYSLRDISMIDFCIEIRNHSFCSIIVASDFRDENDVIVGLSIGADDFVCSPYSTKELTYRIKAQVRRQNQYSKKIFHEKKEEKKSVEPFRLCEFEHKIFLSNQELDLTAREYLILKYFLNNTNRIITKDELYRNVWNECYIGAENVIAVHINHLRNKIEQIVSKPKYLVTVKGFGYKLIVPESRFTKNIKKPIHAANF